MALRLLASTVAAVAVLVTGALAHDPITTKVTWNGEIARIVQARCVRCHTPDGRGPMPLTTWEEARPWAKAIKEEVMTRRMPKWHAARGYGDFSNDPSLSPFEIALLVAWADGGAPQGAREAPSVAPLAPPGASADDDPAPYREKRATSGERSNPPKTTRVIRCGTQPLSGRLLAIRPALHKGASARVAAHLPDGRREVVAWIRNFDPDFPETYWLRRPLDLPPRSRLSTVAEGTCMMTVTLGRMDTRNAER